MGRLWKLTKDGAALFQLRNHGVTHPLWRQVRSESLGVMHAPSIIIALAISVTAGFGMATAAMKPLPSSSQTAVTDAESCLGYIALAAELGEPKKVSDLLATECGARTTSP